MHQRIEKKKWKIINPEGKTFRCTTVVDFGLIKSTKRKRSLKVKSLPKFGKVDQRSELQTMSISKQLGCREKMKKDLCEKNTKTFVNLEARMPCDRKREDYQKEDNLNETRRKEIEMRSHRLQLLMHARGTS